MEFTAVVLYNGALAHYTVRMMVNGLYEASLLKYNGEVQKMPPKEFGFFKEGRHCTGDTNDQDLLDDLYDAVQSQKGEGGLFNPGTNPGMPYVPI